MNNKLIILLITFVFFNCTKKIKNKKVDQNQQIKLEVVDDGSKSSSGFYMNLFNDKANLNILTNSALINGDTLAYKKLWLTYNSSNHNKEFLHIALFMANNNNYPKAYYDVYDNLMLTNSLINKIKDNSFNKFDFETRNLAFSYLKIAASKGYERAKEDLKLYDENGILY